MTVTDPDVVPGEMPTAPPPVMSRSLTLLFDPEHALDERIAMEQFIT